MLKATKIRIYPTSEQAAFLNAQFGAVRFVFNRSLHIMSTKYQRKGISLSAKKDLKKLLPVAKKSRKYSWTKNFDSIALQQACINLDTAFKKFFDKKLPNGYPQFKSKHGKQSSYHCTSVSIGDEWIKIPKCQPIKAKVHRSVEGKLKSITISRTVTGKYFASLLVDDGEKLPLVCSDLSEEKITGIDIGLTDLLIDNNGHKEANPGFLKRAASNLRRKQKSLSRKKKGSANRAKARLQMAKCHEKVVNARQDFQHKLSFNLVDENQAIIVETLKVKNMLKNKKLAKHISDAAWSMLIDKIAYKAERAGKRLVKINQWYASSKTCSCCDVKIDKLPLSVRQWDCPSCHAKHDRDINAAINIKREGILKLKAEGCSVSALGGLHKTDDLSAAA